MHCNGAWLCQDGLYHMRSHVCLGIQTVHKQRFHDDGLFGSLFFFFAPVSLLLFLQGTVLWFQDCYGSLHNISLFSFYFLVPKILMRCNWKGVLQGLYTAPGFPGGLQADSIRLDLSRMLIFFSSGMAGIVQWLSGDFPVHTCQTSESDRVFQWTVRRNITKPAVKFHQKWPDSSRESDGSLLDSNGHRADSLPY